VGRKVTPVAPCSIVTFQIFGSGMWSLAFFLQLVFNLPGGAKAVQVATAAEYTDARIAESGKCRVSLIFYAAHCASLENCCQRNLNECGRFGNVASRNFEKIFGSMKRFVGIAELTE
jgi:hypothetical protein